MSSTTKSPPSSTSTLGACLISFCILAGAYGLHGLGWTGGMIPILQSILNDPAGNFPNSDTALIRSYTGITPIDTLLMNLVPFFGPVVDRTSLPLTIFSFFMFGQFGVGWSLMLLESFRGANNGLALSFITIFGILVQTTGFALTSPIWFLLYITTSPLARSPATTQSMSSLRVPLSKLTVFPLVLSIGYIVPSAFIMLPSPSIVSMETRQKLIAAWQPFPIYTTILMYIFSSLHSSSSTTSSSSISKAYTIASNILYTFLIIFAVITNVLALLVTILPTNIISIVSPAIASALKGSPIPVSFSTVYVPSPPLPSWKAVNLADAVHTFLHVDTYVSGSAALVWALILRSRARNGEKGTGIDMVYIVKLLIWTVLAGPFGAITNVMWERERLLVETEKVKGGI
ncbi:hypothetical protein B7463_g12604, partial [Scytalidium lignicola]